MSQQLPGKRAGRVLMIVAWCAALFLATRFLPNGNSASKTPMPRCIRKEAKGLSR